MSRFNGDPKPKGLPMPRVSKETMWQTLNHMEKMAGVPFLKQEMEILQKTNQHLYTWLETYIAECGINDDDRIQMMSASALFLRFLRKEAEGQSMNEGHFDLVNQPFLPEVMENPHVALPPWEAYGEAVTDDTLTILGDEDHGENPQLRTWIEDDDPDFRIDTGLICGMYWLLKYHSKPREKKT